ncbi:hypothetical protein AVEN_168540-1 [Araneus ventricosus]|uniref:Uncharacterized protein n=1 Tax=Araneus ventricosus TaxID=182803 RepID=A0A4Y2FNC3_ARAVE|nr:hypothetical protein AVEN_168540-1 [Araneus ventricosus]
MLKKTSKSFLFPASSARIKATVLRYTYNRRLYFILSLFALQMFHAAMPRVYLGVLRDSDDKECEKEEIAKERLKLFFIGYICCIENFKFGILIFLIQKNFF